MRVWTKPGSVATFLIRCLPLVASLVFFCLPPACWSASPGDPAARTALLEGRVEDAITLLRAALASQPSAANHLLLCRSLYAEDQFDRAVGECEAAAKEPSSEASLWLGRVEGARAGRANPLSAFVLARQVHAAFARAVALDPQSLPALNDLGEFSIKAPPIVGGDLEQARSLAAQAAPLSAATEHRLLALIARKNKDTATAEREFQAGVAASSPRDRANANINLAQFYAGTRQTAPALLAVHAAIAADTAHGSPLVDAASILTHLHQEPDLAIRCLREYVVSPGRSDANPAFKGAPAARQSAHRCRRQGRRR